MKINYQDKTNFGWWYGTHKRVTGFVMEDFPALTSFRRVLEEASQAPDLDPVEAKLFRQLHFYSPIEKRSFLDFRKRNNAFALYKSHVGKMILAAFQKDKNLCMNEAGRAIHYLQDVTQPQHSQRISVFNKLFGFKNHLNFEEYAKNRQPGRFDEYEGIYNPKRDISETFEELFLNAASTSIKNNYPVSKNFNEWERISANGINLAIEATRKFIEKLNCLI